MSQMICVSLPDGSRRELPFGATLADLALSIGTGLAKSALAGKINGKIVDLYTTLSNNDTVHILTEKSDEGLEIIRHSTAHLMAMAVQELFPGTQLTVGPVVGEQFFYDVKPLDNVKIGSNEFPAIEAKMREIASRKLDVRFRVLTREQAIAHFESLGEIFKTEIIADIPGNEDIKIYEMGGWGDLCRGPHVPNTSKLIAFKLMSIAGAYWKANKDNAQLTRIYGTAWVTQKDLDAYLHMLEEAKKRDHVVLGKQLELFTVIPEVAAGAPFFLPHGAKVYSLLKNYIHKKTVQFGFQEIHTPQIMNVDLWKFSGHYDHYRENMYFTKIDEGEYAIKPMSCPAHVKVFMSSMRSYRELPIRYTEFGVVHRHELSGTLHGLTRVRRITQDDGHIFCTMDQVQVEMQNALKLVQEAYADFEFQEVRFYLSTRPENRLGSDEVWDKAEGDLKSALEARELNFILNEGDGAFYGPKIDIKVKDAIGRWHQLATLQLDFQTASRLGASYVASSNSPETPVMIHRAVLGSIERFMGVFIEHCAGHFPVGLAPVQAKIITVNQNHEEYGACVKKHLEGAGIRVESDIRNEKLGYKIREAQLKKIPYMLVIGDKEVESQTVTARFRDGTNLEPMSVSDFVAKIKSDSGVFWGLDHNQI